MTHSFKISDELLQTYRSLTFDDSAEPQQCYHPFETIFWPDEHPDDGPIIGNDDESNKSIILLVHARTAFWESEQVPGELQHFWDEACELIPSWPGFQRMYLTDEEKQAAAACKQRADEFYNDMTQALEELAEEVQVQDDEGFARYSARIELAGFRSKKKKPWWKLW